MVSGRGSRQGQSTQCSERLLNVSSSREKQPLLSKRIEKRFGGISKASKNNNLRVLRRRAKSQNLVKELVPLPVDKKRKDREALFSILDVKYITESLTILNTVSISCA